MREKAVFFLPVNILTVWSPAFLAARHTTVCLDPVNILTVWSPAFLAARHTTVCLDVWWCVYLCVHAHVQNVYICMQKMEPWYTHKILFYY